MKSLEKYFESKIERMNNDTVRYIKNSDQYDYCFVQRILFDLRDNIHEVLMYANVWEMSITDDEYDELDERLAAEYEKVSKMVTDHYFPELKGDE